MHDFPAVREYVVAPTAGLVYKAQWWRPCCNLGCYACAHWAYDLADARAQTTEHTSADVAPFVIFERTTP